MFIIFQFCEKLHEPKIESGSVKGTRNHQGDDFGQSNFENGVWGIILCTLFVKCVGNLAIMQVFFIDVCL